jgi:DNA-3-methyladenine glycosylase I
MRGEARRCSWADSSDLMRAYHDTEWGVPLHDDRALFEFLCLEGAQAGLSWRTVLEKRENYRRAFDRFDIAKCARLTERRIEALLGDAGISATASRSPRFATMRAPRLRSSTSTAASTGTSGRSSTAGRSRTRRAATATCRPRRRFPTA